MIHLSVSDARRGLSRPMNPLNATDEMYLFYRVAENQLGGTWAMCANQSNDFRKRATLTASMAKPKPPMAAICGHNTSNPTPFK